MAEAKKIPQRTEVPEEFTWDLTPVFPSDGAWQEEFEAVRTAAKALPAYAGRLGESAGTLLEYVELSMDVNTRLEQLFNYAQRKSDQDTRVGEYQAMCGRIMALFVEINSATAFETPELLAIPDEALERFYAEKPELEMYRRYFTVIRDKREHILSQSEEKLLAAAGEMAEAPDEVYSKLHNADLTFPDAVDSKGDPHPLSSGTFVPCEMSEDRTLPLRL